MAASVRNPTVACRRPARTNVTAIVKMPMLKVVDVCSRAQPNSPSRGSTKTLHA